MLHTFQYRQLLLLLSSLLFSQLVFYTELHADDWPRWRGPNRDGVSTETDWSHDWPESGPKVLWHASVGTGFSSIAVSQRRLVTLGNRENIDSIWCFDADTGKEIWSHEYDSPLDDRFFEGGPTSTPTIDDDKVYSLGRQGDLFCLEADSGKIVWSKNVVEETKSSIPGWGFSSSPVVIGDLLILGVGEFGTALNKTTGDIVWSSGKGEAGYMTPYPVTINGQAKLLVASGRAYHLVDLTSGAMMWKHRWLTTYGCNAADPIVDGEHLFISAGYNRGSSLLQFDGQSAKQLWNNKEMQNQLNSSVKIGAHLYGFSGNDTGEVKLQCMDFMSGKIQWQSPALELGSLTSGGDRLIALTGDGQLMIAKAHPAQFEVLAQANVLSGKCWTTPVLANGRLYCRSANGELVCLDLRKPKDHF